MSYSDDAVILKSELKKNLASFVGGTVFFLGDVQIDVEGKDGIGGLIQEWLKSWVTTKTSIPICKGTSSQEFPDYFLGERRSFLEIKCFDIDRGPAFDVANFDTYCRSLKQYPNRIKDSDYLIFAYSLDGVRLKLEEVYLKKIWEITTHSEPWPLKVQAKQGVIYNIRPCTWYSTRSRFTPFATEDQFRSALVNTYEKYKGLSWDI